ncbi:hypothetical protein B0H14DRAFT_2648666 [Mycena olivaceomarginata]|nr:hypothetical protein B0H14DRAFT_2648666 [Mycena olivaceomarginata]
MGRDLVHTVNPGAVAVSSSAAGTEIGCIQAELASARIPLAIIEWATFYRIRPGSGMTAGGCQCRKSDRKPHHRSMLRWYSGDIRAAIPHEMPRRKSKSVKRVNKEKGDTNGIEDNELFHPMKGWEERGKECRGTEDEIFVRTNGCTHRQSGPLSEKEMTGIKHAVPKEVADLVYKCFKAGAVATPQGKEYDNVKHARKHVGLQM